MAGTDRTRLRLEGGPAIVLVRPQLGENIGMAARAMANFGLSDLRIVEPRDGWPNDKAVQAASGAAHVVEGARLYPSVEAAVTELTFVWATTARERGQAKRIATPGEAMIESAAALKGGQEAHGLLFGAERTGLGNEEVARADAVLTFPVNPAFASLNLSQAVLIVAYEWFKAAHGGQPAFAARETPPASRGSVQGLFDQLEDSLEECNYFVPDNKKGIMWRNLRNILHRLSMGEQDVRTLRGVVSALAHGRRSRRHQPTKPPPPGAC